jgi:hypothetical protein
MERYRPLLPAVQPRYRNVDVIGRDEREHRTRGDKIVAPMDVKVNRITIHEASLVDALLEWFVPTDLFQARLGQQGRLDLPRHLPNAAEAGGKQLQQRAQQHGRDRERNQDLDKRESGLFRTIASLFRRVHW